MCINRQRYTCRDLNERVAFVIVLILTYIVGIVVNFHGAVNSL